MCILNPDFITTSYSSRHYFYSDVFQALYWTQPRNRDKGQPGQDCLQDNRQSLRRSLSQSVPMSPLFWKTSWTLSGILYRSVRAGFPSTSHQCCRGYLPFICFKLCMHNHILFLLHTKYAVSHFKKLDIPAVERSRKTTIYANKKRTCSPVPGPECSMSDHFCLLR